MRTLHFTVDPAVTELGVKILTARITGVTNFKTSPDLDAFIEAEVEKVKQAWEGRDYRDDSVLAGFRMLHERVGRSNRKFPASPEVLSRLLVERGRFPRINAVVDLYNLVSIKSRLALGAHDVEHINGNVTLRLTNGDEKFQPLGSAELTEVNRGEYGYIDDDNTIICRLEVLQVEPTKTTSDSSDLFLIIQGNANTDATYIQSAADEVTDLIQRFCGGEVSYLNSLEL